MFEYKILETESPNATVQQLTEFGSEGWELITIVQWNNITYYYFKRPRVAS